jgi:biopolymer transport protein ExbD
MDDESSTATLFAEETERSTDVGLTPLIDVVFQLLVFFLLTSTFALPALQLTLPALDTALPTEVADFWLVELNAHKEVAINGVPVPSLAAALALERSAGRAVPETARLLIDAAVPYDAVARLLQELGEAQIRNIHFVHETQATRN